MQIKTILKLHLNPIGMPIIRKTMSSSEDVGKRESLYILGGIVN